MRTIDGDWGEGGGHYALSRSREEVKRTTRRRCGSAIICSPTRVLPRAGVHGGHRAAIKDNIHTRRAW